MPNVVVTCVFNPPVISLQGANLRQDTIDALQRVLPKHTTTSLPTQRRTETPKFLLTNGGDSTNNAAAGTAEPSRYASWKIDLGQHYCCQKGRSMVFLDIMEALEEEGYAMRGVHSLTMENSKDVTRMIFSRS